MDLSDESRFTLMPWTLIVLSLFSVLPPLDAADIEFVTPELPWAILHKGYAPPPLAARASGACPLGGISFAVVSGELPPGLHLSRLGRAARRLLAHVPESFTPVLRTMSVVWTYVSV